MEFGYRTVSNPDDEITDKVAKWRTVFGHADRVRSCEGAYMSLTIWLWVF
jgi:hypothetical protein